MKKINMNIYMNMTMDVDMNMDINMDTDRDTVTDGSGHGHLNILVLDVGKKFNPILTLCLSLPSYVSPISELPVS
jgi:hypothetical protein